MMMLSNQDNNSLSNSVHLILPTVSPPAQSHIVQGHNNNNNRQLSSNLSRDESSQMLNDESEDDQSLQNLSQGIPLQGGDFYQQQYLEQSPQPINHQLY
jgi:hypothetical protein